MRRALLLLTLGACDRVLGLEERPEAVVTGSVLRQWVTNDATGIPVRHIEAHAPETLSLAVRVGDENPVEVPVSAEGTFSFDRPDEETTYRLQISAEGRRFEIQHTSPTLELTNTYLGRPNDQRTPVTAATYLVFPLTTNPPRVASTGLWTSTAASVGFGYYYVDWMTVPPISGRRGLLSQEHHDRLYFFDYAVRAAGHSTINTMIDVPDANLVDGVAATYPGPLVTPTETSCTHLRGDRAAHSARISAAAPTQSTPVTDWTINAIPEASFGPTGGIELAAHRPTTGPAVDATVTFSNPIRGSVLVASMGATNGRGLIYPGASPALAISALRTYRVVTGDASCSEIVDMPSTVGIPGAATFDGVALPTTDDAVITPGLRETLPLTWELGAEGPVDRYTVSLFEVFEDPDSGGTSTRLLRDITTVEPAAVIEAAVLVPGSYYFFVLTTTKGIPGAHTGDFTELEYPFEQSVSHTGMFRVQ